MRDQAGKSGREIGENYRKIITELTAVERYREEYENRNKLFTGLEAERRSLLEEYRSAAFDRYDVMQRRIETLNAEELKGKIRISIARCKNIADLEDFMLNLHGIGAAKIRWLSEVEKPIDLAEWSKWIENKEKDGFRKKYGSLGMTEATIEQLIAIGLEERLQLEEIELKDKVGIELNIAHESHGKQAKYVPMKNLSIGQRCTAILNLLLIQRDDPLIIDQPEDHLDNAFIAERIVSELRNLNTKRQIIFATHNANIPIFGDAELIVVLESEQSGERPKAILKYTGSIDDRDIRNQAAQILEGGEAAFNMRKEKYGF